MVLLEQSENGKQWFQSEMVKCFVLDRNQQYMKTTRNDVIRFVNSATAKCVVALRNSTSVGPRNSFLDENCWRDYTLKSTKLPTNGEKEKEWNDTKLKRCLDQMNGRNDTILGPPLDPNTAGDRYVASQDLEDLII